jgi:alkylated DNA repair dioxygenase AlkB
MAQLSLFQTPIAVPDGFFYEPDFITFKEEAELLNHIHALPFEPYVHETYEAKRRVVGFHKSNFPDFLLPFILRVAQFAKVPENTIVHALVTEYSKGTPIGWHRDMPPYESVIGISLNSFAPFRLRRRNGAKWERTSVLLAPRSIYMMSGESRSEWQHSIPPVEEERFSITFRTV